MPSDKYRLGVHVDQVRAKLSADINFEQVHAELMAALDAIAAGKGHCDLVEVPRVGRGPRFLMRCRARSNSSMSHLSPNDIEVVDQAYAKLGKTRQSIRKNEVALEILEALIVKR